MDGYRAANVTHFALGSHEITVRRADVGRRAVPAVEVLVNRSVGSTDIASGRALRRPYALLLRPLDRLLTSVAYRGL